MDPDQSLTAVMAIIFAVTHIGLAVLMAGMTTRAASGRLARNQWVGIRTPATMRSDQAWVAGHRAASRLNPFFLINSVAACALLAVGILRRWSASGIMLVGVGFFVTFAGISVWSALEAGRAAKSLDGEGDTERTGR